MFPQAVACGSVLAYVVPNYSRATQDRRIVLTCALKYLQLFYPIKTSKAASCVEKTSKYSVRTNLSLLLLTCPTEEKAKVWSAYTQVADQYPSGRLFSRQELTLSSCQPR